VPRGQLDESLRPHSWLSKLEPVLLLPNRSSVVLERLSGPRSRLTTFFLVVSGNRIRTSGSVARNSDQSLYIYIIYIIYIYKDWIFLACHKEQ
jgi:hypothetical protein